MISYFYYFLLFFLLASFGSFFKLVVDRYQTTDSFIFKPSYCDHTKSALPFWQNIPVVSYLIQFGKSSFSSKPISFSYLLSEITPPFFIFLFLFLQPQFATLSKISFSVFFLILILLSMFDIKHRIIPHEITYSAIVLFVLFYFITNRTVDFQIANLGLAFLLLDLIHFFTCLFKKFKIDENLISVPIIFWMIVFFFTQNVFWVFVPVIAYFILVFYLDLSLKTSKLLWALILVLLIIHYVYYCFIDIDFIKINNLFKGIGFCYFFCEILFYFVTLMTSKNLEDHSKLSNEPESFAIGGGDITVFALISTFLGFNFAFLTLFYASLFALISHLFMKVISSFSKVKLSEETKYLPFVPFLSLACFIVILLNKW